ncbi:MAG: BatD family protein [Elusimicrobiota bacterium]
MKKIKIKKIEIKKLGKKSFKVFIFLFSIFCFLFTAIYANINIDASVDKNVINFGDSISLQVNVSGDVVNIPAPEIPQLIDFNVSSAGTSQNVSFINGRVSASLTYNYVLSPNKVGKFIIGSIKLVVAGKVYSTNPINIEVLGANSAVPQKQVNNQQLKIDNDKAREIFINVQLGKQKVFVNEGVTYTFRFFTSKNLLSNPEYHPPNFTGFMVEDLPPQRSYQAVINGKRYNVIEIKSELFPTAQGTYSLGAASLIANIQDFSNDPFRDPFNDDFFRGFFGSGKSIVVKSKQMNIEVIPLPHDNKPTNFSGSVGNYNIDSNVDKTEIEVNSPVTLTVTISGEGNIKSISEPKFPNIVGVRKYDTVSSVNISKTNYRISGSKIFKTVIIPERAGNFIVPEFEFSYFNCEKKKYESVKSTPIRVKVLPSLLSKTIISTKLPSVTTNIDATEQDIRFIKTDLGINKNNRTKKTISNVLIIISFLIFLISFGYRKYNIFISKNYSFIKSKRAFREFEKGINRIQKNNITIKDFYGKDFDLIIKYFSDKTKMSLVGSTFNEIEDILRNRNLSQANITKVRDILEKSDFIKFTPFPNQNIDIKKESDNIKAVIYDIEKEWRLKECAK